MEQLRETLSTEEVTDVAFMRTEPSIIYEMFTHSSRDLNAELRLLRREYAYQLLNLENAGTEESRTRLGALDDLLTSRGVVTAHLIARVSNGAGLSPTPNRAGSQARNLGAVPAPGAAAANGGRSTTPLPRFQIDTPHSPSAMESLGAEATSSRVTIGSIGGSVGARQQFIQHRGEVSRRPARTAAGDAIEDTDQPERVAIHDPHPASCYLA